MNNEPQARHATVFDEDTRHIAHVYAEALLGAAQKAGQAAEILDELQALIDRVLDRVPRLETFLANPLVSHEHKAESLRRALDGRASNLLLQFLLVVNDHQRLDTLRAVAVAYREVYDERAGRMQVQVRSAVPLAGDQEDRLRAELRAAFGREPVLHTEVDPDLLGGLVVRVEDWVYDASVRAHLDLIRNHLIERSSYELQRGRDRFRS